MIVCREGTHLFFEGGRHTWNSGGGGLLYSTLVQPRSEPSSIGRKNAKLHLKYLTILSDVPPSPLFSRNYFYHNLVTICVHISIKKLC